MNDEASRNHRVTLEVAGEKPEVGTQIKHRAHHAFAIFTTGLRNLGDAIEHQHRGQRQLRPLVEQFAAAASQEIFIVEGTTPGFHPNSCPYRLVWQVCIHYHYRGSPVQEFRTEKMR